MEYDGAAVMTSHVKRSSAETASRPSICGVHALYGPQAEFGFGGCLPGKSYGNYVFSHPQESLCIFLATRHTPCMESTIKGLEIMGTTEKWEELVIIMD